MPSLRHWKVEPVPVIEKVTVEPEQTVRLIGCWVIDGGANAVLGASVFHFGDLTVRQVKERMRERGIEVRL